MKCKHLLMVLVFPLILGFSLPAFGQQFTGINIIPQNPTSADSITFVIQGQVPNQCIHFTSGIFPPVNDTLGISLYDSTCPPPDSSLCPAFITDFSVETKIGPLSAGSYLLKVEIIRRLGEWVFCEFPHFFRPFCKTSIWQDSSGYHFYNCCWVADCPIDTAIFSFTVTQTSSVPWEPGEVVSGFDLFQNYPNPFNPSTTIHFTVHGSQFMVNSPVSTTLKIYNILGQKVKTLMDEPLIPGSYEVIWDGKDDSGNDVSIGIYFYRIKTLAFSQTKKMVLLR